MRRRRFLSVLGGAAAWPLTTQAQQLRAQAVDRRPLIGMLILGNPDNDPGTAAFRLGLRELGYVEGRNITIEFRFAEGRPERLPQLAEELVRLKPDILCVLGGDVAVYLGKATQTIPIVFAMSSDPTKAGLAESLARPGGNSTGVTFLQDELAAKRLQLLKEAAPRISHASFIWNPDHADNELVVASRAAGALGIKLTSLEVNNPRELETALIDATQVGVDAIYVVSSRLMVANSAQIVASAFKARLPLVGGWGTWVRDGALISYGPNVTELVRNSAAYVDKILKGSKPADLPVQQPTRFELFINLKTAKAIDLTIPESFLSRADRVIE